MKSLTVSASPHITNKAHSTRGIMLDVLIALLPCVIAATLFFGYHVAINVVVCAAACFGAELLYNLFINGFKKDAVKKNLKTFDFSALVTGVILALNLPSKTIVKGWNLNFYESAGFGADGLTADAVAFSFDTVILCILGSLFAIMLVKMLFGGIGKNFANPAATARIFLTICFGFTAVKTIFMPEAAATWLSGAGRTNDQSMFLQMILGNHGSAAVGETSMIAILLGLIYLSVRKVIDFRIPLLGLISFALFAFIFDGLIARNLAAGPLAAERLLNNVFANVMAGGFVFGLVFMATDYSTTPNTFIGHMIFVIGYALITVLIRTFANLPEGASFAILLMNIVSPIIDRYVIPKPFGYVKPPKEKKAKKEKTAEVQA